MNITVTGHQNSDTDSVVSAIIVSKYLINDSFPVVLGKISNESKFVLSKFNIEEPPVCKQLPKSVFLVDHNEMSQSIPGISEENIVGVIDHHRLSGLKTDKPLFVRIEPLGSTSTIIYKIIKERGIDLEKKDAGMLLCALISDTLNLTSVTTTEEDREVLDQLSSISEINVDNLAKELFEAKSDFSDKSMEDLVTGDMKEFNISDKNIVIGVCETTSTTYFDNKESEVLDVLKKIKETEKYDAVFFCVIDILKEKTYLYLISETEVSVATSAFNQKIEGSVMILPGVTSRKSQIFPPLSKVF